MAHQLLKIGPRVTVAPIIHGSGDCAIEVRRLLLSEPFDCIAVPLPPSFQDDVERGIQALPAPSVVIQRSTPLYQTEWTPESDREDEEPDDSTGCSYVPVDPCQPVISALRSAIGEHLPRKFIDLETANFEPYSAILPDPYALKRVALERFAAAILPVIERPAEAQRVQRIRYMAHRLRQLSVDYSSILFVCSVLDWPWIREAFFGDRWSESAAEPPSPTSHFGVSQQTLYFLLGELPYVTSLYERARAELDNDENLSIDGVKELLIAARAAYKKELKGRARKLTPQILSQCLKYIRNLTLVDHRFSPELTTIVTAAKQIAGDQYAMHVLEMAKSFPSIPPLGLDEIQMGIERATLPDGEVVDMTSRLPGPPLRWRSVQLQKRPDKRDQERWKQRWNPFQQCSWPPEDKLIEDFRAAVFDRARQVMGADLARTEKFTTSILDGIDIRDTLRHWYEGEIYVRVLPPNRGRLDSVVMLFDAPADPRDYRWRTTWYAEHEEESTLSFYATNFHEQPVGPGICLAQYGGAFFLFPPKPIPDVWQDRRLDFTETLEERLVAAACLHSRCQHVALLSPLPPGAGWRRLARRFKKSLVHLPLNQFSDSTIQQLRMVHVLNGKQVRSFAADFIRRA